MQAQIIKAVLSQALLFGIKDALEACEHFSFSFFSVRRWATKDGTELTREQPPSFADTILMLVAYSKARGSAVGLTSI